jgi:hypothetical protein
VDVDAPEEFFDWLDRIETKARNGDEHSRRLLARATDALTQLRGLREPPKSEKPDLKRVRQSRNYPVWRTAHPFDPDIAFRLICWFPPNSNTVVVALFGADKAPMGDVFYDSVGTRADVAINHWLQQIREEREQNG